MPRRNNKGRKQPQPQLQPQQSAAAPAKLVFGSPVAFTPTQQQPGVRSSSNPFAPVVVQQPGVRSSSNPFAPVAQNKNGGNPLSFTTGKNTPQAAGGVAASSSSSSAAAAAAAASSGFQPSSWWQRGPSTLSTAAATAATPATATFQWNAQPAALSTATAPAPATFQWNAKATSAQQQQQQQQQQQRQRPTTTTTTAAAPATFQWNAQPATLSTATAPAPATFQWNAQPTTAVAAPAPTTAPRPTPAPATFTWNNSQPAPMPEAAAPPTPATPATFQFPSQPAATTSFPQQWSVPPTSRDGIQAQQQPTPALRANPLRQQLTDFLRHEDPGRVAEVDALLAQAVGKELEFFGQLVAETRGKKERLQREAVAAAAATGAVAAVAAAQSAQPQQQGKQQFCLGGHPLVAHKTPQQGWSCDVCGAGDLPAQSDMHGCRVCNWDICAMCSGCQTFPRAAPAVVAQQSYAVALPTRRRPARSAWDSYANPYGSDSLELKVRSIAGKEDVMRAARGGGPKSLAIAQY